jgi:butyrate kinase
MGGGISIAAHHKGKMVDCNDIVNGDGPMAPTRSGFVPAKPLIDLCFSGKFTQKELSSYMTKTGGIVAHLGTNDMKEVRKMVNKGNKKAKIVYDALVYQIVKQIGAMYASLKCNCSAIIFTGGMSKDKELIKDIKQYIKKMAKVVVMPGEFELEALAAGAIRVLTKEEEAQTYTGETVFKGI